MANRLNMTSLQNKQNGIVIVFATLAMAVIIGAGALALDVGNLTLSKSKLQNLADSAALSAAKVIDLGGDHGDAIAAGNQAINDNLQLDGFNAISINDSNLTFEFSETLPFDTGTTTATSPYVRVRIENVDIQDFLVSVFNIDMNLRASAVAGPSTSVEKTCNITPLSICEGDSANTVSGYASKTMHVLKASSSTDSSIGSGNFQPVALTDSEGNQLSGASSYKEALAGSFDACLDLIEGTPISTEPGNMVGPSLGIDTRFGIYTGDMKKDADLYPPDINSYYSPDYVQVQTQVQVDADGNAMTDDNGDPINKFVPDKSYSDMYHHSEYITADEYTNIDYETCLASSSCQNKGYYRRIITVPILKCDDPSVTKSGGRMDIPLKGLACFYLVQPMSVTEHADEKGGGGNGSWLIGEFLSECRVDTGNPGQTPNENGPYKIVLFKDPDSGDS